ncbi:hypothetical protein WME95_13280 [Sorangium sp. So ce327]|uniref:hypothetical protein n=1 Tax=Sorangium sp. So ce327 TaxID=3133301 RepID=UPI003F615097
MRSRGGRSARASVFAVALCAWSASALTACRYSDACWEGLDCAPDPEPPPDPCEGEPGTAPALNECGVFVSASSGNDRHPGTKDAPVKTLQHAIGLAAHGRSHGEEPTRRVYACGGSFEEKITLPSGVDLWGGRLCDGGDWSYDGSFGGPNHPTIIAPQVGIPLRVIADDKEHATSTVFGVRVAAADASADDGKSSIAMILSPGARAIVRQSKILAGDGKEGEPGEDAPSVRANSGVLGNDGADACTADAAIGALPVVTVCGDGIESTGGYGGDGGMENGGDGASGLPAPVGSPENRGLAGSGASSMPCTNGGRGAHGADAEHADGAVGVGRLDLDGWIGVRGKDGKSGGVGQGGGGGGGSRSRGLTFACPTGRPQGGAAGGSGGSGGCGGKGGDGGDYGGASIGIVALQGSALTVEASQVLGGKGGNGGVGGTGQPGGGGSHGGNRGMAPAGLGDMLPACNGGTGGNGGRGGDGGGGLGGASFGIASMSASVNLLEDATVLPGQPGQGGRPENAATDDAPGQGRAGPVLFWYRFDAPDPEPPQ